MNKVDILGSLPRELSQQCLLYVNDISILKLIRNVSKTWQKVVSNDYYWKYRCKIDNIADDPTETRISKKYMNSCRTPFYYERLWIYKSILRQNWLTKPTLEARKRGTLIRNSDDNICFHDKSVTVLCSRLTGTFNIYNADIKLIDAFYESLDSAYWYLPLVVRNNDIIIIYYECRHIIVRDVKRRVWLWKRDFKNVSKGLVEMHLAIDGDLIAASIKHKKIVSFLDVMTGNIKFSVKVDAFQFMTFYNNSLLTVTLKGQLRIYNIKNGLFEILHQLDTKKLRMYFGTVFKIERSYLFINDVCKKNMLIYDIKKGGQAVDAFTGHVFIRIRNSKLVYRESSHCIKIKDYTNVANDILTINTEKEIINADANNNFIIVASSSDITFYDFFTGEVKRIILIKEIFDGQECHVTLKATDTKLIVLKHQIHREYRDVSEQCFLDFDITL